MVLTTPPRPRAAVRALNVRGADNVGDDRSTLMVVTKPKGQPPPMHWPALCTLTLRAVNDSLPDFITLQHDECSILVPLR